MQVREFLEKMFSARLEQEVVVMFDGEEYPVKSIQFDGETIRIRVDE